MSLLVGVCSAIAVGVFGSLAGLDKERSFYTTTMIVIAFLYVLFACVDGSSQTLLTELLVSVPFVIASVAGFKKSMWLVVAALLAHGTMDIVHGHFVSNKGVPVFWPAFCSSYDIVAAGYLAFLLLRSKMFGRIS